MAYSNIFLVVFLSFANLKAEDMNFDAPCTNIESCTDLCNNRIAPTACLKLADLYMEDYKKIEPDLDKAYSAVNAKIGEITFLQKVSEPKEKIDKKEQELKALQTKADQKLAEAANPIRQVVLTYNRGCFLKQEEWNFVFKPMSDEITAHAVLENCAKKAETLIEHEEEMGFLSIGSDDVRADAMNAFTHACTNTENKKNDRWHYCKRWIDAYISEFAKNYDSKLYASQYLSYTLEAANLSCKVAKLSYGCRLYEANLEDLCNRCKELKGQMSYERCIFCSNYTKPVNTSYATVPATKTESSVVTTPPVAAQPSAASAPAAVPSFVPPPFQEATNLPQQPDERRHDAWRRLRRNSRGLPERIFGR